MHIELIPGVEFCYNDRHPKPPTPIKPPTPPPAKEPTPTGKYLSNALAGFIYRTRTKSMVNNHIHQTFITFFVINRIQLSLELIKCAYSLWMGVFYRFPWTIEFIWTMETDWGSLYLSPRSGFFKSIMKDYKSRMNNGKRNNKTKYLNQKSTNPIWNRST